MKVICHPEVAQQIRQGLIEVPSVSSPSDLFGYGLDIHENPYMEREKPTGRYLDLQGRPMEKDSISVSDRFVEYGPEDLDLLLFLGLVRPEMETLVYVVNDRWKVRMFNDYAFVPPNPFVSIYSSFV